MSDPLGLSIGTFNLVAVRAGRPPVARRSVLTLFGGRLPEVGVPEENPEPTEPGLVLRGFVERVGDPVPLVAADGSAHRGEELVADALDALGRLVGYGAPVSIALPAHWGPGPLEALRTAVRSKPGLAPGGVPPVLVTDAAAATAVLRTQPGLPPDGVVALCDFGAGGTSITLIAAAANFAPIGPTVRYGGFGGEQVDQAIANHLLAGLQLHDTAGTATFGSLTRLRDECRSAKERLSAQTATVVPVDLPGFGGDVRLTRGELEDAISSPLSGVVGAIGDALARNMIPSARLSAVAIVGGGAVIPAVGASFSERLRVPVITTTQPGFTAAVGAAMTGQQPPPDTTVRSSTPEAPTRMTPTAWTAGTAGGTDSVTFRALAWSQDDSGPDEPVPYSGADYVFGTAPTGGSGVGAPPVAGPARNDVAGYPAEPEALAWYKRPVVLFGLAAALALAATGGLAYTLTGSRSPTGGTTGVTTGGESPRAPEAPATVIVTAPDGSTSLSTIPPSPSSTSSTSSTSAPTSSTTATTTTTASQPTTTTQPTTSAPPPSTKRSPPATTAAPSTVPSTAGPVEPTAPTGSQ